MSKSVKIKLPEIEVSDDVDSVHVSCYKHYHDGDDQIMHNRAGFASIRYIRDKQEPSGWYVANDYVLDHEYKYITEDEFKRLTQPPKEMTVEELEKILGHKIKIVGDKK